MDKGAIISNAEYYRYSLWRIWDDEKPLVLFIMLNPSTADAEEDDATIRRCIRFVQDWGYGGLLVGNLFGFRATQPSELLRQGDPVGDENDYWLGRMMTKAEWVVAAWGANGTRTRALTIAGLAHDHDQPLFCLGETQDGQPRHPLRLAADTQPELWGHDPRLQLAGMILP